MATFDDPTLTYDDPLFTYDGVEVGISKGVTMESVKYAAISNLYTTLLTAGSQNAQVNPTLVTGDVQVSRDGGAFANIETEAGAGVFADYILVSPAGGVQVKIVLNAALSTCKVLMIRFVDMAGAEWDEQTLLVYTHGNANAFQVFDLSTAAATMRGTDAAALAATCTEARLAELDGANLPADVLAVNVLVAALNNLSAAQVNAEVVDALGVDTIAELTQGIPTATPTIKQALMLLYMALRNKAATTSTEQAIYNDAGTKIAKATLSDDGTTFTKDELVSGA